MKYGEKIYLRRRINLEDGVVDYGDPIEIILKPMQISVMPISDYQDIKEYGIDNSSKWQIITYRKYFPRSFFKNGDLLYLDGVDPIGESEKGQFANAIIKGVSEYNLTLRLIAERRIINESY